MAVTPKIRRSYKGAPVSAVLDSGGVTSATQTSISLTTSPSTWPTGKFFVVVAPGTAQEEKMCVTVSGSTLTVVDPSVTSNSASANGRGVDDTTARSTIAGGATVYPVATARDFDEANQLTATYANQGGVVYMGDPSFTQLAIGTAGQVLKVNSGATAPEWGQVAAAGIASDAVTTAKILDANVTTAKIADSAVTSAKIANGTIALADLATVLQNALPPVGTIVAYGGSSAPTGWLLCDGNPINASYTTLIALVGANTPNFTGRVAMGKTGTGAGHVALNATGGDRKIASNHLPTHTHTLSNHTHSGTTSETATSSSIRVVDTAGTSFLASHIVGYSSGTYVDLTNTSQFPQHSHTFTTGGPSTDTSGNGGFANDDYYQPFVAVNYIIKHDYV